MAKQLELESLDIEEQIPPGTSRRVKLHVANLPLGTTINIHVFIYRGVEDGPTLLLMAGLHGDEVCGVEIVRRMMKHKQCMPQAGTVMAIPVLNIYGFLSFVRELPDGKDANRSFPGSLHGSLASKMAYNVTHNILPHVDFGVDFHTGGASRTNFPQIRCDFKDTKSLEMAKAFAPPYILNSATIAKSFRRQAKEMGKPILVYEGGESQRFDEFAIEEGINGTLRLMHKLGMINKNDPPPPTEKTKILNRSSWTRAKHAGLARYFDGIKPGAFVKKNQQMGTVTDPYNDFQDFLKAPNDGYIIGMNNAAVINTGNALIHLGMKGKGGDEGYEGDEE